jgi:hypothetical protein
MEEEGLLDLLLGLTLHILYLRMAVPGLPAAKAQL